MFHVKQNSFAKEFFVLYIRIMKHQNIKDYSISKEEFELKYNNEYQMYETHFINWDTLDTYYKSDDYISHTDGKRNLFEKVYQIVKDITIKQKWKLIKKFHDKPIVDVLDIGCGTGDFLKYGIEKLSLDGVGVEPSEKARTIAQSKKISVAQAIDSLNEKKYDVITLWHVLEHVKDLDEYFTFFKNHLKEDGLLVIAVPNFKSYDAIYYKNYWAAWDVPRHLWHFSKTAIKKLGAKHEFNLIHIEPMYFDSFYISMLSEEYKSGSKNPLKAFYIGWKSNFKAKRSKEYSSHIYILKK
ncbi:class I SAM-dependent methyltransferase [Flavobacterium sp. xlx-214]|uniref:class I SAM-dependent methyltransferase n=1 Tax=unclassified Flavobacterium TaxID=196869 RepID=UPI00351BE2AE